MKKVVLHSTDEVRAVHTSDSKLYTLVSRQDDVFVLARDVNLDRYEWRPLGPGFTGGLCYEPLLMQGVCQDHPRIAIHNALEKFYDVFEFDFWTEFIKWKDDKPKSQWRLMDEAPKSHDSIWAIIDGAEVDVIWSEHRADPGAHRDYSHSYGSGWADRENNYPINDDVIEAWRPT